MIIGVLVYILVIPIITNPAANTISGGGSSPQITSWNSSLAGVKVNNTMPFANYLSRITFYTYYVEGNTTFMINVSWVYPPETKILINVMMGNESIYLKTIGAGGSTGPIFVTNNTKILVMNPNFLDVDIDYYIVILEKG